MTREKLNTNIALIYTTPETGFPKQMAVISVDAGKVALSLHVIFQTELPHILSIRLCLNGLVKISFSSHLRIIESRV